MPVDTSHVVLKSDNADKARQARKLSIKDYFKVKDLQGSFFLPEGLRCREEADRHIVSHRSA